MNAGAAPRHRIMAFAGLGLSRAAMALPICISLTLIACVHFEKQSTAPALVAAERRLAQAEKQSSDVEGQAGEFFAVAKIAAVQLSSDTQPDPAKSSVVALYNRATADLAAHLPDLIRQQQSSTTLSLKDPQSGQIDRLQLESGSRGEYPPTYF
jgi:hypothetical protein